ncbi:MULTISPECIES: XRE family transcriptional regulator [unclassified Saccharopolyspora]|uniref:XRE family transcriptional regulator n=1 Tax=unclassified Saccharopolyspora TaxID=2646250 RepID=UPI001CD7F84C|nr:MULTISPECIES: XRE family transcriptional regulator [unclassified Saccharopolyspora]MCA1188638.1 helix-turn-helix domain-containing protein [Saccharopolyspora sp. 6T]MCA1193157.1 helix-turn-helix domain-containing protein [Saccharopolyspora sp. 6V]MCA1227868.1 helix-turn-helix domain-containing protein [Saccharopolyspora sp. 6M]MCA1282785.1 helix-turn-helix domain-containing protein [Saccharopolyspora sp. 7B]
MSRSWDELRDELDARDRAAGDDPEALREQARQDTNAYVLGFRLAELRKRIGLTQGAVAERMGVTQARVSQIENGELDQMAVSSIRSYITALGGRLKLVVDPAGPPPGAAEAPRSELDAPVVLC